MKTDGQLEPMHPRSLVSLALLCLRLGGVSFSESLRHWMLVAVSSGLRNGPRLSVDYGPGTFGCGVAGGLAGRRDTHEHTMPTAWPERKSFARTRCVMAGWHIPSGAKQPPGTALMQRRLHRNLDAVSPMWCEVGSASVRPAPFLSPWCTCKQASIHRSVR